MLILKGKRCSDCGGVLVCDRFELPKLEPRCFSCSRPARDLKPVKVLHKNGRLYYDRNQLWTPLDEKKHEGHEYEFYDLDRFMMEKPFAPELLEYPEQIEYWEGSEDANLDESEGYLPKRYIEAGDRPRIPAEKQQAASASASIAISTFASPLYPTDLCNVTYAVNLIMKTENLEETYSGGRITPGRVKTDCANCRGSVRVTYAYSFLVCISLECGNCPGHDPYAQRRISDISLEGA